MQVDDYLNRRIPTSAIWVMAVAALVFAGHSLQSGAHLNHDVSYFVHFSRWLLQGRELGRDLFDGNLPMVWLLFMPPAALAHWGWTSEPMAVRLTFWLYFTASAVLLATVLRRQQEGDQCAATGWLVAFILMATLGPGFSFGQREYACVLLGMPYLGVAALRLQRTGTPGAPILVAVGLVAAVGYSLKPYFLAVPALVELALLARLGWRGIFARAESLAMGLGIFAYVLLSALLLGDYLRSTIEFALSTYWAYDSNNFPVVLDRYLQAAEPVAYGLLAALLTRSWSANQSVMLLAFVGFSASYFVQSKGFLYHAFPVMVSSMAFLTICVAQGLCRAHAAWKQHGGTHRLMLVAVIPLLATPGVLMVHDTVIRWYAQYNTTWGAIGQLRQAVIEIVDREAPSNDMFFYGFSTHPFPGFPTASYTHADWSGRSIVQPFIPAYARIDEVNDEAVRREIMAAAEYQRRMVIEDFERRPPSIVFVENHGSRLGMGGRQFDDVAFYMQDRRFQEIWQRYQETRPIGPLRVFVLAHDARGQH